MMIKMNISCYLILLVSELIFFYHLKKLLHLCNSLMENVVNLNI